MIYGALDLAAKTGVCFGEAFQPPQFETWKFEGELGRRGVQLRRHMLEWIERAKPVAIFVEQPLTPRVANEVGVTIKTNISLNGYVFLVHSLCYAHGIPCHMHERQEILGHFVGKRRFPGEKDGGKKACLDRCSQLRWSPTNLDEADAAALWDFGCTSLNRDEFMKRVAGNRPVLWGRKGK